MVVMIAGFTAAAVVWVINCLLLHLVKEKAVFIAPAVEETAKTLTAILLGTSIVFTHLIFGLIESIWDMANSRNLGLTAALLSIGGHVGFGLASEQIFIWRQNTLYAIGGGLIVHLSWNFAVLYLIKLARAKG